MERSEWLKLNACHCLIKWEGKSSSISSVSAMLNVILKPNCPPKAKWSVTGVVSFYIHYCAKQFPWNTKLSAGNKQVCERQREWKSLSSKTMTSSCYQLFLWQHSLQVTQHETPVSSFIRLFVQHSLCAQACRHSRGGWRQAQMSHWLGIKTLKQTKLWAHNTDMRP